MVKTKQGFGVNLGLVGLKTVTGKVRTIPGGMKDAGNCIGPLQQNYTPPCSWDDEDDHQKNVVC